jgi:hypothetical protein
VIKAQSAAPAATSTNSATRPNKPHDLMDRIYLANSDGRSEYKSDRTVLLSNLIWHHHLPGRKQLK